MTIDVNDRLYKEFATWAKANGMDDAEMVRYIENAFREKFTLDKYGDLNEKVGPLEQPKRKTTRKTTKPEESKPAVEQISELINEPINELINEPTNEEPPKRKSKVLASK